LEEVCKNEPQPQAQEQPSQDAETAFEEARILEKVERSYEKALEAYNKLLLIEKNSSPETIEKAGLGSARCLMKLGRYEEARAHLKGILNRSPISEDTRKTVEDLLVSVRNLGSKDRPDTASSVDNLVWQLLDAASSTDEKRAATATDEVAKMGKMAVPALIEAARDREYFRSVTAFDILSRIGGEEALAFMMRCTADPDPVLRKRCLDGFIRLYTTSHSKTGMTPVLIRFLQDEEESFVLAALKWLGAVNSSYFGELPEKMLADLVLNIEKLCSLETDAVSKEAVECAWRMVKLGEKTPFERLPVEIMSRLVEERLDHYATEDDLKSDQVQHLSLTIDMASILGSLYGREHLLEQAAGFWPFRNMYYEAGNSKRFEIMDQAMKVACLLPPEKLAKILEEIIAAKDSDAIMSFGVVRPTPSTFYSLPEETQCRYLRSWASSGRLKTGQWSGRSTETSRIYNNRSCTAQCWAALVEGALENPEPKFGKEVMGRLNMDSIPVPFEPCVLEALHQWSAHPDPAIVYGFLYALGKLINDNKIDPGLKGAFQLMDRVISSMKEPIVMQRKWIGNEFRYNVYDPTSGGFYTPHDKVLYHLQQCTYSCFRMGDLHEFERWVSSHSLEPPGFTDLLVSNASLMQSLIGRDPDFIISLWERMSPLAREALFESLQRIVSSNVRHLDSSAEWLPPLVTALLKDWECDEEWFERSLIKISSVLYSLNDPALSKWTQKAVLVFLNTPKLHLKQNEISMMMELIKGIDPELEGAQELIPAWFEKISSAIIEKHGLPFRHIVMASPKTLSSALEWLTMEEYGPFFKKKLVDMILDRNEGSPAFYSEPGLDAALCRIWPRLDAKTRNTVLTKMTESNGAWKAGTGLWIHIIKDQEAHPVHRHMAFAVLLASNDVDVLEPVLDYMRTLGPGEAEGVLDEVRTEHYYISRFTSDILRLFPFKSGYLNTSEGVNLTPFPSQEFLQPLCLGIMSLPEFQPKLARIAVQVFEVNSDTDLGPALKALRKPMEGMHKATIFAQVISYMLKDRLAESMNRSRHEELAPVPEEALDLLKDALNGELPSADPADVEKQAISLIGRLRVVSLMHRVGEIALEGQSSRSRAAAVSCLGRFHSPDAVPFLLECFKDENKSVRDEARDILDRMREYKEQKETWAAYVDGKALGMESKSPGAALVEMLSKDDPEVRLYAIKALGKLAEPSTLPVLVKIMSEGTKEERAAVKSAIDAIIEE